MARRSKPTRPTRPKNLAVDDFASKVQILTAIVTGALGLAFAWIQIKHLPFPDFLADAAPGSVRRVLLAIYYACWVFGTNFDTRIQSKVYTTPPTGGKLVLESILIVIWLGVWAALMFWMSESDILFGGMITGFMLMNIAGWKHIVDKIKPAILASRRDYINNKNFAQTVELDTVAAYICDRWQIQRFLVALLIIILGDVIVLAPGIRGIISATLSFSVPMTSDQIYQLLPVSFFLIFLVTAEGWIMFMRLKVQVTLTVLRKIDSKYKLQPL